MTDRQTWFYARVSSRDQNLARQLLAAQELGIDDRHILTDKQSGKDFNRKAYNTLVGTEQTQGLLRKGDLLVIYSLDRLGRNYTEIREQWHYLTGTLGVDIRVIDVPLLNTDADRQNLDSRFISDLVLQILSYVAEKERLANHARQEQGLRAMPVDLDLVTLDGRPKRISQKTGNPIGRSQAEYPDNWDTVYAKWTAGEIRAVDAMRELGLTKSTFYNLVKRMPSAE